MIGKLLSEYKNKICHEEINLVADFYKNTNDIDAATILAEKIAACGYGKAFDTADKKRINEVTEYISIYDIAKITKTSVTYIHSLPFDIQDELIECYISANLIDENISKKLFKILDLKYIPPEKKETVSSTVYKKPEQRPSLLKRLRYYQNKVKNQQNNQN